MKKIRLGILGTSEIAFRRFLPALKKCVEFEYIGVASRELERTPPFVSAFGGRGYGSYEALLKDTAIDAVYIPLPPALHGEWGEEALRAGKHVLMEKPFTTSVEQSEYLLRLSEEHELAVHENYMFLYHSQLAWAQGQVRSGIIGDLRLVRAEFGFPRRSAEDFRYCRQLGGGALLDCGGYTVRLATLLLGGTAEVTAARLCQTEAFDVDIYGSATLENKNGQVAQISFGMDNSYKCELGLWGSTGCITLPRIFTAPAGFHPQAYLETADGTELLTLPDDDSFYNSILAFYKSIIDADAQVTARTQILQQGRLLEAINKTGGNDCDHNGTGTARS